MRTPGVTLEPRGAISELLLGIMDPDRRPDATEALCRELAVDALVLFLQDPELGISLPAPGFAQVLNETANWKNLVEAAFGAEGDVVRSRLPMPGTGIPKNAASVGCCDGTALVVLGGSPCPDKLAEIHSWLPWVSKVFRSEAGMRLSQAKQELSREVAQTSKRMSSTLQGLRTNMEDALRNLESEQAQSRMEKEERQKFVMLVKNSNDFIAMAALDGAIGYLNPSGCRLVGLANPGDAVGTLLSGFLREDYRTHFNEVIAPTVLRDGNWEGEAVFSHFGDGRSIHVLQNVFLVRDSRTRKAVSIATVVRDVTDRKKAEEALKRTEEQLQQSQKMESIGKLAGGIAHDFNNLLTAINGYAALSLEQIAPDHPLYDHLSEIRNAGERAASLTRQLLAYSRKQVLATKILNVDAIVADMRKMLGRIIGEELELVHAPDPLLGCVRADPGQMEQVILNLVVNARDATPPGGRIIIETSNVELDEGDIASHPETLPGPYVLLAVADTGSGIEPHILARIFEPFFTTKDFGSGSGMGLSMVQGIVNQSGGHIQVHSEPGKGSVFKVYLPRVRRDGKVPDPAEAQFRGAPKGNGTILLAEDEETVRKLARKILEREGYTILEAMDGQEGIDISLRHQGPIDLLLTDVIMPKRNGRELAKKMLEIRPGIKVVFMSGYTDDSLLRHGLPDADTRFLQKPFVPDNLLATVREMLDRVKA